ncbi:MAG: methyltransferase domain-containing protein [Actinobacteria bacterium]|nr:methyltransferase domain-containing protein [Actinomycetota bacterium]
MSDVSSSAQWREDLSRWAIPTSILSQAEESPWIHPVALFGVPDSIAISPSHDRAREACDENSTVLDVGCGGGIAALATVPPVKHVIGVDHQPEMLDMFSANAAKRKVTSETFEGFWPEVSPMVPVADVVTSHHVVFNVPEIDPFVLALNSHARKRIVIEMPVQHPLSSLSRAWKHFWDLDRPVAPGPVNLLGVLTELDLDAKIEYWSGPLRTERDLEELTELSRIRLCLPKSRTTEVREFLENEEIANVRKLATIWWDK